MTSPTIARGLRRDNENPLPSVTSSVEESAHTQYDDVPRAATVEGENMASQFEGTKGSTTRLN